MKTDIYEDGHRVPFIVSWTEIFPANKTSIKPTETTSIWDEHPGIVKEFISHLGKT